MLAEPVGSYLLGPTFAYWYPERGFNGFWGRYTEEQLAADLAAAGFTPAEQEWELGGMAILTLVHRG